MKKAQGCFSVHSIVSSWLFEQSSFPSGSIGLCCCCTQTQPDSWASVQKLCFFFDSLMWWYFLSKAGFGIIFQLDVLWLCMSNASVFHQGWNYCSLTHEDENRNEKFKTCWNWLQLSQRFAQNSLFFWKSFYFKDPPLPFQNLTNKKNTFHVSVTFPLTLQKEPNNRKRTRILGRKSPANCKMICLCSKFFFNKKSYKISKSRNEEFHTSIQ